MTVTLSLKVTEYSSHNMDVETASDNASIDDEMNDFCENFTRDASTEDFLSFLKPMVDQLDNRMRLTRICQMKVKEWIEYLMQEYQRIKDTLPYLPEADSCIKKLIDAEHRMTITSNILQTNQERLHKVHQAVEKMTAERKTLSDNNYAYNSPIIEIDKGSF